jgi:phosphoribosylformylglycinamidine synthase subunit PurS
LKRWLVEVRIQFKPSVFDPQGHAVENAAHSLGYRGADGFRVGKYMTFTVTAATKDEASQLADEVCDQVLCNPVMETYSFSLVETSEPSTANGQALVDGAASGTAVAQHGTTKEGLS